MENLNRLLSLLSVKRGHNSAGEREAIRRFLDTYKPLSFIDKNTNEELAYAIITDPNSTTLFSCHTDTVHHTPMAPVTHYPGTKIVHFNKDVPAQDNIKNHVIYDANLGIAYKDTQTHVH